MRIKIIDSLKLTFIFFIVSLNTFSQENNVFTYLDLTYPGLEKVLHSVEEGNYQQAKIELLKYYQTRTNRTTLFEEDQFITDEIAFAQNINNIFSIKNSTIDFGDKIDWQRIHQDKEWQFSLCRMNWFNNFIGMYDKTRNEKIIEVWQNQIISWMELNDPGFPRTLDTGRRLENLVTSYWKFITDFNSTTVSPDFNAELLFSMYEQTEWLLKPDNWRRYSNWGTFESSGFLLFVVLFPEFKSNEDWLKEVYFRMRTQLNYSFYPDGMHIETSPSYHSHELEVWFNFIKLTELNDISDPWSPQNYLEPIEQIILRNAKALMYSYKPTGFMPQLGDTDHDNEIKLLYEIGKYYNDYELIYVGSMGKEGVPPKERSITYPQGGYTFIRSGWGEGNLKYDEEFYLNFDSGLNKPWHAHYDILSVNITAYGKDLVRDAGRFTYNDEPDRDLFMSTAYHNTVTVDGIDQSRYERPQPAVLKTFENSDYSIASHNGYEGVNHTRSIFFVKNEYWIITDYLKSDSAHIYEQKWHLSEDSIDKVNIENNSGNISTPNLIIHASTNNEIKLEEGFLSYLYREKIRRPVISVNKYESKIAMMPTVLIPYEDISPSYNVEYHEFSQGEKVLATISNTKFTDFYFESFNQEIDINNEQISTDAQTVFLRFNNNNQLTYMVMTNGSYLEFNNKDIISMDSKSDVEIDENRVDISGNQVCSVKLFPEVDKEIYINGIRKQ